MNHNVYTHRSSMRGLRRCARCGKYNGNRAKGCANQKCSLHYLKKGPDRRKRLIDAVQLVSYNDTKLFSVRVKDRDPAHRNFVQIIDITLTADQDGSIVSRNAICFVDTCKYDSTDLNISCKHVKSASECTKQAMQIKVVKDVLFAMNISGEMKESLWSLYCEHDEVIPAIQQVNKSTFVVKCKVSAAQAAGRLHASVSADDETDFNYSCGCKKLRIVMSPNNSVVLENATCDHLILLLAGVLSSDTIRKDYQKFTNALSNLWMQKNFDLGNALLQSEDFISYSENMLNTCIELTPSDTTSDQRIFNLDPTMHVTAENAITDEQIQLINVPTCTDGMETEFETTNMELAECQIELMDQFKLTNQIDLCNDDIQLYEADLFADNQIVCSMDGTSRDSNARTLEGDSSDGVRRTSPHSVNEHVLNVASEKQRRRERQQALNADLVKEPSLDFENWLDFVIEKINSSIDVNCESPVVALNFDVKHEFFAYLSCKFSIGVKRRIPNNTIMIKKGKHKGLVKSAWIFTTASSVKRIFSTKSTCIDLEHVYLEKSPGCFVSYDETTMLDENPDNSNRKLKRILPSMFKAYIQFGSKSKGQPLGLTIEWIPVYPKSHFGVMSIQFQLGFKKNNKVIEKNPTIS